MLQDHKKELTNQASSNSTKLGVAGLLLAGGAFFAYHCSSASEAQVSAAPGESTEGILLKENRLPVFEDLRVPVETPPLTPTNTTIALHEFYEVKVKVEDKNGNPVCRAEVSLTLNNPDSNSEDAYQLAQPLSVTDQNGISKKRFRQAKLVDGVTAPIEAGNSIVVTPSAPLPPGHSRVCITANCTGYSKAVIITELDLTKESHELSILLDRGSAVVGRVRYSDGRPVENAVIACGLYNGTTNELGDIVGIQKDCDGKTFKSPGIFGLENGRNPIRIWSKEPGYEEFTGTLELNNSDIVLDVVLHPTPKISLTVVDCLTREPLLSDKTGDNGKLPQFSLIEWTIDPTATAHNLEFYNERISFDGSIENESVYLRHRESTHFAFGLPGTIGPIHKLPKFADVQSGSAPIPIEICVVRTKPISLQATVMTKNPDGTFSESQARMFRIYYSVNGLYTGDLSTSYWRSLDIPAGEPYDFSSSLTPLPTHPGTADPINRCELFRIECVVPDLRQGTLTDLEDNVLSIKSDNLGSTGTLIRPISLIADPTPAAQSVPVEYLSFRIYPHGS